MQAVWYRNDLRTKDHEPLFEAAKRGAVIGIYFFDPRHFVKTGYGFSKAGPRRVSFLIESIRCLREELNGNLIVRIGKPEIQLQQLVRDLGIRAVHYHSEVAFEEIQVADAVKKTLTVPLISYPVQTLYHPSDIPFTSQTFPEVFTSFRKKVEKTCKVRSSIPVPELQNEPLSDIDYGQIPSLSDFGFENPPKEFRSVLQFYGGEKKAWERVNHYFFETDELQNYKFKRNGLLGADYSSKFSPWLANGCISARSVYQKVTEYERNVHKNISTYWLKFELIWRDYFRFSAMKYGNAMFKLGGIQRKQMNKKTDKNIFWKWAAGQTGIPFIDANMRELNQTGFMSNRGRQNVASFLAQNVDFDWRWGAAYFESKLIDYDVYSNWGNWAYNATVGHDPRNRYFNIIKQAQKYDAKGEFVRTWLPELSRVPAEYIHKPHTMALEQQKLFGVQIGNEYPEPVVDLEKSYKEIE